MKIGQEVICIKGTVNTKTGEKLEEGKIYSIKGFSTCQCPSLLVNVGFKSLYGTQCLDCKCWIKDETWWLYADRFVPLDEIDISEITRVLNVMEKEN